MHYHERVQSGAESSRKQHTREAGIPQMPAFSLVRGLKLGCDDYHRHQSQDKSKESKPDQLASPPSRASGPERHTECKAVQALADLD